MNIHNESNKIKQRKELKRYNKQLHDTEDELLGILKIASTTSISQDSLQKAINEIETKKEYLQKCINDIETSNNMQDILSLNDIEVLLSKSKKFLCSKNLAECKKFINSYVDSVIVYNNKVEVKFNFSVIDNSSSDIEAYSTTITREDLYKRYIHLVKSNRIA